MLSALLDNMSDTTDVAHLQLADKFYNLSAPNKILCSEPIWPWALSWLIEHIALNKCLNWL